MARRRGFFAEMQHQAKLAEQFSYIAGSIITVAGVSFSITIAVLAMASVQYGPRLIRNFIRDTGNQVVLGTFLAPISSLAFVLSQICEQKGGAPAEEAPAEA